MNIPHMRTPLQCFVEYGFAKNRNETNEKILDIFISQQHTRNYIDITDEKTLNDYYDLVNIANNKQITYDEFIYKIKRYSNYCENYIWDFPIEIILKILSRVYNVVIQFLSMDFDNIVIDNTVNHSPYWICIYQHDPDLYFNVITLGDVFAGKPK